jgi:glutamine amidotransferase
MASNDIAIVDGGGANFASLQFALQRVGADSVVTSDHDVIRGASHVILPGVGAARAAMDRLQSHGLHTVLPTLTQPVLGICLGMQLLAARSDEDNVDCLGILPDRARKLSPGPQAPVPNMGWCQISKSTDDPLLDGIEDGSWFYFIHSYALPLSPRTIATAAHSETFAAVVARDNFRAAQFHPERSAKAGARLLQNFLSLSA